MTQVENLTAAALVDGVLTPLASARLAMTDEGVARGDGAFETIGVWDGHPFRLDDHLRRLDASLAKILLPPADADALRDDVATLLDGVTGDAALRFYVTGSGTRITTVAPQPARAPARHLVPQVAPWIVPTAVYEPAGAKTMSYGQNMTATRAAKRAGGDDALLLGSDGTVLEGPTFCVFWVTDGTVHSVPVERGIVDSISRRVLRDLAGKAGHRVIDAEVGLDTLIHADEVFICSSVRPVIAVEQIDTRRYEGPHPVADELDTALDAARRARQVS